MRFVGKKVIELEITLRAGLSGGFRKGNCKNQSRCNADIADFPR